MDVIPSPPAFNPSRVIELQQRFSTLALDMTRIDGKLEASQANRSTPQKGWDTTFDSFANRLDSARTEFAQVLPSQPELAASLGADALFISRIAGKLDMMQDNGQGFASGWDRTLDRSISDAQRAAQLLVTAAQGS